MLESKLRVKVMFIIFFVDRNGVFRYTYEGYDEGAVLMLFSEVEVLFVEMLK